MISCIDSFVSSYTVKFNVQRKCNGNLLVLVCGGLVYSCKKYLKCHISFKSFAGRNEFWDVNEYTLFFKYFHSGKDNLLSQLNCLSYLLENICKFIRQENNTANRWVSS